MELKCLFIDPDEKSKLLCAMQNSVFLFCCLLEEALHLSDRETNLLFFFSIHGCSEKYFTV